MSSRLLIGIAVPLVIIIGGLGFYSYDLNRQVDRLNERITSFQDEQSAFTRTISDNLATLRTATESGLSSLETNVTGARDDIASMKSDLASAEESLASVTEDIGAVSAQVTTLDERVAGAETGLNRLSSSIIDSATIYQKAVKATVRITDGHSLGSGFICDTEGRVVTAYHVVKDLSTIYVIMYDGRVSIANVLGFCPYSDVAVLKLDDNPSLEPLLLADSGNISVGEPVIAIGSPLPDSGNPLGMRDTLTAGIISQVNRYENIDGLYIANLLQFDAAVNPGNSGGPLIDSQGKVVGINEARIDPLIGSGIYWAIAANKVKRVAEAIIATGSFAYPLIGTGISDLTPELVKNMSLDTTNGALVSNVVSGGPAQSAGIQTRDIIISMDGLPMRNVADLTSYLGEFKSPGDTTVIEVMRGASKLKITVTVGERTQ